MKHVKFFLSTLVALSCVSVITSCDDDDISVLLNYRYSYDGKVAVSPNPAKVGDSIQLSMKTIEKIRDIYFIDGENVIQSISYYIDGALVAESSDSLNNYVATYEISDISAGTHEVTAHCNPNSIIRHKSEVTVRYDIIIDEHIDACTLTIEE